MKGRALITATAAALAVAFASSAHAATPKPVPSLTPAATMKLWHRLVDHPRRLQRAADCKPTRAVFYAATDWLRLATNLAQNASPCAQYYVSVPPLTGDKTQPRAKQASLIRALGPNMHALAEINFGAWTKWVAANGGDWFTAGVTARQRMVIAGYDVNLGDTWAMNEVSTAVRRNTGSARRNLEEFLRGLYDGGGTPVKGVVYIVGQSQGGDQSAYKATLQAWLQDSTFWDTVNQYVSDWMQEDYADPRTYAVAGTSPQQRRDQLAQYFGHPMALANAGVDLTPSARAFMVANYGPLANGAWAWASAFGWTQIPFDQMEDFVSAQTYAMRALDAQAALPTDRLGFGWAPNNTLGIAPADFTRQTAAILQRLAQSIRDSGEITDDPGIGACQPTWCTSVIDGAAFTSQWAGFSIWTGTGAAFTNPPLSLTAGATSGALTVQLKTGSVPQNALSDTSVVLTTTSPKGLFSASPAGPWTPSLTLLIPAGTSSVTFYYQDTLAGTPTLSATIPDQPPATQVETVVAAAPATLKVAPHAATTLLGGTKRLFSARVADAYGNPSTAPVSWRLTPPALGTVVPASGDSTTLTASSTAAGRGRLVATVGSLSDSVIVKVVRPPARVRSSVVHRVNGYVVVVVTVVRGTAPAKGAHVSLTVRRGSSLVAKVSGRADAHGRFTWRSKHPLPSGHYRVKATAR